MGLGVQRFEQGPGVVRAIERYCRDGNGIQQISPFQNRPRAGGFVVRSRRPDMVRLVFSVGPSLVQDRGTILSTNPDHACREHELFNH
ncbi:hypothetical protein GCM10009611_12700 [Arthrobacter roseus]